MYQKLDTCIPKLKLKHIIGFFSQARQHDY